jgi:pyridoxine 5'-phosphate synthase PdxJ
MFQPAVSLPPLTGDLSLLIQEFDMLQSAQLVLADYLELFTNEVASIHRDEEMVEQDPERLLHCWQLARSLAEMANQGHVWDLACQLRGARSAVRERAREANGGGAR